ncbi:unnamed protein product [Clavelina lepadiformis]|uniref:Uncharacterized protein n=1 Tax=Clavelina lepadiformis TaxID=159417 RepID=A0ABP0GJY3_CLALP
MKNFKFYRHYRCFQHNFSMSMFLVSSPDFQLDDNTSDTPAVASPTVTFTDLTRPDSPLPQSSS